MSIVSRPKYGAEQKLPLYGDLNIRDLYQLLSQSKTEFYESMEIKFKPTAELEDFDMIRFLGSGSFADVYLVANKRTHENRAMKVMNKTKLIQKKQVNHVQDEKTITQRLNYPFVIYLENVFKDNSYIYFVMPYIPGGELFAHLQKLSRFDEEQSKFICAQVVLGLEYLHYLKVAYRDMKPENVLIDHVGYIKLTDFTFAKILKTRTYTFCGTPEYIAPEVIMCQGYGLAADWWAFGILLFELNSGAPPFRSKNQIRIFEKTLSLRYFFPSFFSSELKDLIRNMLQTDLSLRFGNLKNGVNDIKTHIWFKDTLWMSILNRKVRAPYIPDNSKAAGDNRVKCKGLSDVIQVSAHDLHRNQFADF